jgi:hypothetical protein
MIEQDKVNYSGYDVVSFENCDSSKGLPKTLSGSFDIYFSSYASLSHLTFDELTDLTIDLMEHIEGYGVIIYGCCHGLYSIIEEKDR